MPINPGPGEARLPQNATAALKMAARSPLAQLLHALNQPLTGLQCSMEVALASPRTPEQYAHGLREGLELTERMRALVEAIREVAEGKEEQEKKHEALEPTDLTTLLRDVVDELRPVAEAKSVPLLLDCSASALTVVAGPRRLAAALFRLLESAVSLSTRESALRIETGAGPAGAWIRIRWHAARLASPCSRPELGLLVAQAGWERAGAEWERERAESLETVTVRWPRGAEGGRNP